MRTRLMAAPLIGLAVLAAACSSGGGASPSAAAPSAAPATVEPSEAPVTEAPSEAAAGTSVATADNPLGTILVDAEGKTLYVFVPDNAGAPTCYDDCATAWPPLLTEGDPAAGDGVTATDLATTERTDGGTQVTFKGWPLYYFQGDQAAGDTNGQGLNEVWWVVGPDGTMIGAPAAGGTGAAIATAENDLGTILVDGEGKTLYVFVPDNAGAPTCYDDCATAWPPLLTEGDPAPGEGLTAGDFATAERTDGGTQVTFKGWPLYYFQNDAAAGDTNGQGLNDVWFVVAPDGTMIGAPES